MELVTLTPRLHLIRFPVGQAYIWVDDDGVTLVDTGVAGAGDDVLAALRTVGADAGDLRRIVITHGHGDHAGALAEIRRWSAAPVIAHRLEAPAIRGLRPMPQPDLLDWEKPLFEQVGQHLSPPRSVVDVEVDEGVVLPFGGGAVVLAIPGHTAGSIAIHLAAEGVLFTGDTVAEYDGDVILGVFNQDRSGTIASVRRLADLDTEIVAFGHGQPVLAQARSRLQTLAGTLDT